jgi:hypothetical protein
MRNSAGVVAAGCGMAILGIVELIARSAASCEIELIEMIVADRRSTRTPILARNSFYALGRALADKPWHLGRAV